jgi:hypothetical protein
MCAMSPRLLRPLATGFNPKSLGTLALWLDGADRSRMFSDDAATTLSADDGQVAVYKDKANGYNLSQTTANNRPLVRANTKNGRSVLEFDGSNDGLASPALVDDWPAVTAFAVFNMDTTGVVGRLFERGQRIWFRNSDSLTFYYSGSSGFSTTAGSVVNGSWFYCTVNWTGAASGATGVQQRVNGASSGAGVGSEAVVSAANVVAYVGNRADNGRPLDGYMAELLIYSQSLSAAAIAKVENYLKTKWGL